MNLAGLATGGVGDGVVMGATFGSNLPGSDLSLSGVTPGAGFCELMADLTAGAAVHADDDCGFRAGVATQPANRDTQSNQPPRTKQKQILILISVNSRDIQISIYLNISHIPHRRGGKGAAR